MSRNESIRTGSDSDRTTESVVGSNERTNERTDVEDGSARRSSTVSDARTRTEVGALTLREILADAGKPRRDATLSAVIKLTERINRRNDGAHPFEPLSHITRDWDDAYAFTLEQQRWPIMRTGDRMPLPAMLRSSILRRDQETCGQCGWDLGYETSTREAIEVDHCVPWSAGGSDDSDNLRVLCHGCNQRRSNFIDLAHLRAYRPTTWWCFDCWASDSHDRRHYTPWHNGTDLSRVPFVDDPDVTTAPEMAFCAFCRHYTLTTHYLVGPVGRRLIEACDPTYSAPKDTP